MATVHTRRLIVVIRAADRVAANDFAAQTDAAGVNTFHAGLSASGAAPATHYWCSWAMRTTQDSGLRTRLAALVAAGRVAIFDGRTVTPDEVLATTGLRRVRGALN